MADWPSGWDTPRALLVALAAVMLVTVVVLASTSTAAFGTYNPAWDGASDLREAARDVGTDAVVARNLDPYNELDPNGTVAVVLAPTEPYSDAEVTTIRRFLDRGGTLVVADDFGSDANRLLAQLGAESRIDGRLLRDDRHFYRSPELPEATNVSAHRFTVGVDRVTVNHASSVSPGGARVLVATSEFAYADRNRNGAVDDDEALGSYPIVTVERVRSGTVVVAGDPSLFINVMLERPGNAAFVRNVLGTARAAILDYSHAGDLPPLALAVLVLRGSPVLQVTVGLSGIVAIALWSRGTLHSPRRRRARPTPPVSVLTEDQLVAYLERRHPEWDEARIRRVVRGIMHQRRQPRRDE